MPSQKKVREIGTLNKIVQEKLLIIKSPEKIPPLRSTVVDKKLREVAKVIDIIGPVKSPYIVARILNERGKKLPVGSKLYAKIIPKKKRPRKR